MARPFCPPARPNERAQESRGWPRPATLAGGHAAAQRMADRRLLPFDIGNILV